MNVCCVSGCDSEGGHLNGQPNAPNDHHHHQYQSGAALRQEVRHNDRDAVSLGRVRDVTMFLSANSVKEESRAILSGPLLHEPFKYLSNVNTRGLGLIILKSR